MRAAVLEGVALSVGYPERQRAEMIANTVLDALRTEARPPIIRGESEPIIGGVPGLTLWSVLGSVLVAFAVAGVLIVLLLAAGY